MAMNICQLCKREFSCKRRDKRHCSPSCRAADRAAKATIPAVPSEAMKTLGLALVNVAPEGTSGYRLALPMFKLARVEPSKRHDLYWFPVLDGRRSLRWDGSFSDRPHFVLTRTQFEPPRVPLATTYVIQFVDAHGLVLPTPQTLESGIRIAEASRMSAPGTNGIRQSRGGSVRNLVDLTRIAATSSNKA